VYNHTPTYLPRHFGRSSILCMVHPAYFTGRYFYFLVIPRSITHHCRWHHHANHWAASAENIFYNRIFSWISVWVEILPCLAIFFSLDQPMRNEYEGKSLGGGV
jgi:hypothetical protein